MVGVVIMIGIGGLKPNLAIVKGKSGFSIPTVVSASNTALNDSWVGWCTTRRLTYSRCRHPEVRLSRGRVLPSSAITPVAQKRPRVGLVKPVTNDHAGNGGVPKEGTEDERRSHVLIPATL